MGKIELLCLGTGDAESAFYDNIPCTSFVLLLDGYPVLLIGVGPGVLRSVIHYAHLVPECILLLNASVEQANELSALLLFETQMKRKIRVFASKEVCGSVGELLRVQLRDAEVNSDLVSLVSLPVSSGENDFFSLVHDFSIMLHIAALHPSRPGTTTNSAVISYKDQPVLALSGPVGFDGLLYAKLCQAPFVVVWGSQHGSATRASIYDVAAFSDKVNTSRRQEERVVFLVSGYGAATDAPLLTGYVTLMHNASPVVIVASEAVQSPFSALHLPLVNVRKTHPTKYPLSGKTTVLANDAVGGDARNNTSPGRGGSMLTAAALHQSAGRPPSQHPATTRYQNAVDLALHSPQPRKQPGDTAINGGTLQSYHDVNALERWLDPVGGVGGAVGRYNAGGGGEGGTVGGAYDTRKIFVFTNEDKGAPGKLLLLKNFRSLYQLSQRVAQIFSLKPIKEFHYTTGVVVRGLDELADGTELIAVRRGGAPFSPQDLPRLLKSNRSSTR